MITAYVPHNGRTTASTISAGAPLPEGTRWVDLSNPTMEELAAVSQHLKLTLPLLREVRFLEQRQQAYSDKDSIFLQLPVIIGSTTETPVSGSLLLAMTPQMVLTLRMADSRAISQFAADVHKHSATLATVERASLGLLMALTNRLADLSEITSHELERVSHLVFQESLQRAKALGQGNTMSWRKVLIGLGKTARLNHRLMGALIGLDRALAYLQTPICGHIISVEHIDELKTMQHELRRLLEHANAMVSESNFLLDAIVGAISIEQNNVVKIFSMAAVILMPPTMIASIYGMNFVHMPELNWLWGYPAIIFLMLISGIVPWWWFKRKGWF